MIVLSTPMARRQKNIYARRSQDRRDPVVVHFVQHLAHPPIELEEWPDEDRRSRLVFITRGLEREPVTRLFAGIAAVAREKTMILYNDPAWAGRCQFI
jgi:G3E family GTPase